MNQKKITILSEDFPPYAGGIAQWAHGVATSLHDLGHTVNVVTRYRSKYVPFQYPFPLTFMNGNHWKQLRTYYCYRSIRDLCVKNTPPDAIIATTWNCARGIIRVGHKYQAKVITIAHGLEMTRAMSFLKRRWLKKTLAASDRVIAVSGFTQAALLKAYGLTPADVPVIPNGVNLADFFPGVDTASLRKKLNLTDEKIILTLARVIERKGHDQVIKALPQVLKSIPRLKYLICGPWEESYYRRLKRLITTLHLENVVHFTGYADTKIINDLYNLCDIYIMPSRELVPQGDTEGFGITFLEANACEKPVIGGKSGGVGDAIVDGETGFLVNPLDTDALARKMILLLEDPSLAQKMGRQGRERILKGYTWKAISQKIVETIFSDQM